MDEGNGEKEIQYYKLQQYEKKNDGLWKYKGDKNSIQLLQWHEGTITEWENTLRKTSIAPPIVEYIKWGLARVRA